MSIEASVAAEVARLVEDRLNAKQLKGLAWSDDMPDDDPDAEWFVTDGVHEYVMEVDVFLHRR